MTNETRSDPDLHQRGNSGSSTVPEAATGRARWSRRARNTAPGVVLALVVAVGATLLGNFLPVIGGPVFGILLGVVAATVLRPGAVLRPGLSTAAQPVLKLSIVLLGATLSLQQVAAVGLRSLPVMLGTLAVALLGAWLLGRLLDVRGDTGVLIGVGTGICGASAIAATTAVLKPRDHQVAYAIGTIFVFNIAAVLVFPPLGQLFSMSGNTFGLWAGTAINDTSSVVAAAYSFGADAGPFAIVVKLTRTLMLIPIVLTLALWKTHRDADASGVATSGVPVDGAPVDGAASRRSVPWTKIVPLFLLGFVLAAALNSLGVVPDTWHDGLTTAGTFLITTALAGIGLSLRLSDLRRAGFRPLVLGGLLWVLVTSSSLALQALTGTL